MVWERASGLLRHLASPATRVSLGDFLELAVSESSCERSSHKDCEPGQDYREKDLLVGSELNSGSPAVGQVVKNYRRKGASPDDRKNYSECVHPRQRLISSVFLVSPSV